MEETKEILVDFCANSKDGQEGWEDLILFVVKQLVRAPENANHQYMTDERSVFFINGL